MPSPTSTSHQRVLFAIRTTGLQDSPDLRQRMAAQILRQMIDEKLQIQDAKRLGLKATDGELQQRFGDIERSAGMPPGQFKQYLQSIGVPFEIAVQQIEAQIAWNKIIRRKVRPQVDVSEGRDRRRAEPDAYERRQDRVARRRDLRADRPGRPRRRGQAQRRPYRRAAQARRAVRRRRPAILPGRDGRRPAASSAGSCPARSIRRSTARSKGCRSGSIRSPSAAPPGGISCTSSTAGSSRRRGPTTCAST